MIKLAPGPAARVRARAITHRSIQIKNERLWTKTRRSVRLWPDRTGPPEGGNYDCRQAGGARGAEGRAWDRSDGGMGASATERAFDCGGAWARTTKDVDG